MVRTFILIVLLLVPPAASAERPIELLKAEDVADIEALDGELEQLIAKVRQCVAVGLASTADCYCYYPSKMASAKQAYSSVLEKHPEWEGRSVLWWDEDRSYSSNLHLRGLKVQIERSCSQI